MNDQIREEALKIFVPQKTAPTIAEYQQQKAIRSNFERLKSERMAREAAGSK